MLSNSCKYAIRGVIYLALNSDKKKNIGIKKISEDLNIPSPFLGKILQMLVKKRLLASAKGPNGGFSMAKPANEIALLDIIEIIDGLDFFNYCLIGMKNCLDSNCGEFSCPIHEKYEPIKNQLFNLFKNQTIRDLVNKQKKEKVMI